MRIELDLSKHCVETELKRQHNRAVSGYFHACPGDRQQLERIIELTRQALKSLDFGRLRTRYPQLAGGGDVVVILVANGGGFDIVLDEEVLDLTSVKKSIASN